MWRKVPQWSQNRRFLRICPSARVWRWEPLESFDGSKFKTDVSPNRQVMTEFMINDYGVHIDEDNFNVRFEQHPNSNIRISRNIHLRSGPQNSVINGVITYNPQKWPYKLATGVLTTPIQTWWGYWIFIIAAYSQMSSPKASVQPHWRVSHRVHTLDLWEKALEFAGGMDGWGSWRRNLCKSHCSWCNNVKWNEETDWNVTPNIVVFISFFNITSHIP